MEKGAYIVTVTLWEKIKLHFFSVLLGAWVICKMLIMWIWDANAFFYSQERDSPPSCLVDSSLGQHKYVKLKGVKLHYVESGAKHFPVVLLLHGFPDCWLSWRHQIPILSQYFRVIALDLKGFGDSDKPLRRSNYRIEVIIEELRLFITTLGVSSCCVVGHDIGAFLGWCLAQHYPEVVDKFVSVSNPHPNICRRNMLRSWNYQWLYFVQLPYFPELDALREDVRIVGEYHSHLSPGDTYLEAYKYSFSRKEDWSGPLNYYRNFPNFEIVAESIQVHIPVLLIIGNDDKFVTLKSVVKSTDYCEKFQVKIVEGVGHFPHQENPFNFNSLLLKFLVPRKPEKQKQFERGASKGIMNLMFGAVSSTVKYGNSVLDTVHKRTNGVVGGGLHSMGLGNHHMDLYEKTEHIN